MLVFDHIGEASAAALVVNGQLDDLLVDPPPGQGRPAPGAICVVRVARKLPNSGAFCEMAGGAQGFLRDAKGVGQGDRILAQVVSFPEPGKAVTLTRRLLLKGPRLILTPGRPGVNVSRRIGNETERERLKAAVEVAVSHPLPDGDLGVIIRTSARDAAAGELARELTWLLKAWADRRSDLVSGELRTGCEGDALDHALREWLLPRPEVILCLPDLARRIGDPTEELREKLFCEDGNAVRSLIQAVDHPFEAAGVHEALAVLALPEVALGEGSMVIEPTRALVAVDVNTGGDLSPAAGLKINLAAARELLRQLRLRGLGGKIVIDFSPMPKTGRRRVEEALGKAVRACPVETSLAGWTPLGQFELQRKRERRPLSEVRLP